MLQPLLVHDTFKLSEWEHRAIFVQQIEDSCRKANVKVEWFSDYWIAKLTKNDRTEYISAFLFPINNAAAVGIARDKVATYHVLAAAGIATVKHWLVRFPPDISSNTVARTALKDVELPIVLKPCDRGGGVDVFKVTTHEELTFTLTTMATRYRTIAASPYEDIIDEFRIVLLDQNAQLIFRKLRNNTTGEWRHNLQFGASPEVVEDNTLRKQLISFAQKAAGTIGLRFCAVDIITTKSGMKIMEINASFSLSKLAASPAFLPLIAATYDRTIQACFDL